MVLSYEVASSTCSTGRIHAELGVVTCYAAPTGSGPQPMEIDQISQSGKFGKGKGKGTDGKGKHGKEKAKGSLQKVRTNMMANKARTKEMIRVPIMVKERRLIAINVLIAWNLALAIATNWRKIKIATESARFKELIPGSQGPNATTTTGRTTSTVRLVTCYLIKCCSWPLDCKDHPALTKCPKANIGTLTSVTMKRSFNVTSPKVTFATLVECTCHIQPWASTNWASCCPIQLQHCHSHISSWIQDDLNWSWCIHHFSNWWQILIPTGKTPCRWIASSPIFNCHHCKSNQMC